MFQPLILDIYFVIGQKCFKTGIVYFGSGTGQFIFGGVIWWIIMATRVNFTNKDGRCIPISMGKKWTDHCKGMVVVKAWMGNRLPWEYSWTSLKKDGRIGQENWARSKSVALGIFGKPGGAGRPKNVRNDEQTMKTIENSEIEEAFARDFFRSLFCFVSWFGHRMRPKGWINPFQALLDLKNDLIMSSD